MNAEYLAFCQSVSGIVRNVFVLVFSLKRQSVALSLTWHLFIQIDWRMAAHGESLFLIKVTLKSTVLKHCAFSSSSTLSLCIHSPPVRLPVSLPVSASVQRSLSCGSVCPPIKLMDVSQCENTEAHCSSEPILALPVSLSNGPAQKSASAAGLVLQSDRPEVLR